MIQEYLDGAELEIVGDEDVSMDEIMRRWFSGEKYWYLG